MSEWKDISTAPKTGEVFLAYWRDMPVFVAWGGSAFVVLMPITRPSPQLVVHGNFAPFTPSHWMDLPPPPAPKGEGDD